MSTRAFSAGSSRLSQYEAPVPGRVTLSPSTTCPSSAVLREIGLKERLISADEIRQYNSDQTRGFSCDFASHETRTILFFSAVTVRRSERPSCTTVFSSTSSSPSFVALSKTTSTSEGLRPIYAIEAMMAVSIGVADAGQANAIPHKINEIYFISQKLQNHLEPLAEVHRDCVARQGHRSSY